MMARVAIVLVVAACSTPHTVAPRVSAPSATPGAWTYEVEASKGAVTLAVDATFSAGSAPFVTLIAGAAPYVRDLRASDGDAPITATRRGGGWQLASCARGCRVRYAFALRDAARALDDRERGFVRDD